MIRLLPKILGRNLKSTPASVIVDQMNEPRPLPMGRKEFDEWSDRIISGSLVPGGEADPAAFIYSQKIALANMIMHLGPTESHKPDAFFIHTLRKGCVSEVAYSILKEAKDAKDAKAAEEAAKKASSEAAEG